MYYLDTDAIERDLTNKGFMSDDIQIVVEEFFIYQGIEVIMDYSTHGHIKGMDKSLEIPRNWCGMKVRGGTQMKLFVKTIEFSHADCSTPVESTLIYTGAEIEYIAILKHGTIVASRVKMHIAKI